MDATQKTSHSAQPLGKTAIDYRKHQKTHLGRRAAGTGRANPKQRRRETRHAEVDSRGGSQATYLSYRVPRMDVLLCSVRHHSSRRHLLVRVRACAVP